MTKITLWIRMLIFNPPWAYLSVEMVVYPKIKNLLRISLLIRLTCIINTIGKFLKVPIIWEINIYLTKNEWIMYLLIPKTIKKWRIKNKIKINNVCMFILIHFKMFVSLFSLFLFLSILINNLFFLIRISY